MPTMTDLIPLLLFTDMSFLRTVASAGLLIVVIPYLSARPIPLHHAPSTRFAHNPAERFLPCHRVSIVFP